MRAAPINIAAIASLCLLQAAEISPQTYLDDVKYLASPELKGRATGSPELEKAASYIAKKFESFGLKPVGGHYEQAFPAEVGAHLGPDNGLSYEEAGKKTSLTEGRDYVPFAGFSASNPSISRVSFLKPSSPSSPSQRWRTLPTLSTR